MHPVYDEVARMLQVPAIDPLTGLATRSALLATLFRETDRAQRSREPLTLVLFEIDDFEHWKARLGRVRCDAHLVRMTERISRRLRSYDIFGRTADHQFLLILPGCSAINANLLTERLRAEAFMSPATEEDTAIGLSACFGIASSEGRSPVVVMREAELALSCAQQEGPDIVRTFSRYVDIEI